ncbi:MAG TPA: tripartite tricarboxylate transporter substrate-binding protein [Pseudolabrys sp.]|nr:tripartite tricarboxylate transporter substrate-binding protein [Pseudolabrys sp.]
MWKALNYATLALLATSIAANAQTYPDRPITIVVPVSAGGPTDALARTVAERMSSSLGQRVLVENVTGAAGNIGMSRVARANPDGYTIGIGLTSTHVFNGAIYHLPFDPVGDFEPVALIASNPQFIVSKKDVPAKTLPELIAWLKDRPGSATMATIGVGSPAHIAGVLFQKVTGTQFQFVPYRGGAPGMQDLLAGQVDLMIVQPSLALPQMKAGNIRAYAVTASTRSPSAPELPSVDEAGAPGLHIAIWHGFWAPKGTPTQIVARLNAAVREALANPTVRQRFATMGQEIPSPDQQNPEALRSLQKAEITRWWPIIKTAGIKVE